ncbi:MAG: GSCFA domain-containing protein, partial [Muribaculaceae bacterium]|nr:GSCFA domain-containing protein [Muribaculaceae bacterium]
MKFRTEYVAKRAPFVIDPSKPTVLLGSCFADNIAARMRGCLWEAENPLGTLYNPLSIATALEVALEMMEDLEDKENVSIEKRGSKEVSEWEAVAVDEEKSIGEIKGGRRFEESLFEAGGMWRSWLFDSKMSAEVVEDVRFAFVEKSRRLHSLLSKAEVMFVTFGTAWCYYLSDSSSLSYSLSGNNGYLVANCHKQPSAMFERRRLNVREIVEVWKDLVAKLKERYPQLRIVFTVSPVRHLKDGFEGNARSKAILLLATEELCNALDNCYYFPAYEIVNDDLRDYRFYASDLVHPSEEAVEYIWEIFKETYVDAKGLQR